MIIANPIYDTAFKLLMENERVAKFFIGTLTGETIEHLEAKPQELHRRMPAPSEGLTGWSIMRYDFVANIRTVDGERKKVLIEVQKARDFEDVMRFRRYLAGQYAEEKTEGDSLLVLPITTIYVLGFDLPEITSACIKVGRTYVDMLGGGTMDVKSDFVEKLTHDSYVVQAGRILPGHRTSLYKLLSLFEQRYFITTKDKQFKDLPEDPDLPELQEAARILAHIAATETLRKEMEEEEEAWRTMNALIRETKERLRKKESQLENALQELAAKDKALGEKDKALEEKEKALEEKDKEAEANRIALEAKEREAEANRIALEAKEKEAEANRLEAEANKKALEALLKKFNETTNN